MVYMTRHMYLPALSDYSGDIAQTVATKDAIGIDAAGEKKLVQTLTDGINAILTDVDALEKTNDEVKAEDDIQAEDDGYRDKVIPAMAKLRSDVDAMEKICSHEYWPVPSYNKMLFYV